MKINNAVTLN